LLSGLPLALGVEHTAARLATAVLGQLGAAQKTPQAADHADHRRTHNKLDAAHHKLEAISERLRDVTSPPSDVAGRDARRVRFGLPLQAASFTGREPELQQLDRVLRDGELAVVAQAIVGQGGVGKSQLAARYVYQHADEYDIVAWIRAEDGGIADLSTLAVELGLRVRRLSPAQQASSALRWLSSCDEHWLLVLDNLAAPAQLRDCCPSLGNGRVIVTTRDRAMAQFGPVLFVDVFDEPTAVEYLLVRSGRMEDRDGAVRLARALGFLPLALSHAAAYCIAGTSFDDYLKLLGSLPAAELFDDHPDTSYEQTVASTWQLSIQAAEREAPLARQVLTIAAHLAPDAIPRDLFEELLKEPAGAIGRKRLLDAFNALHRLSLAQVDDSSVHLHRLLQKTIRDDPAAHSDHGPVLTALAAVAAAFPSGSDRPQTWPQSERLLPHALALSAAPLPPGEADEQLVDLLNSASLYLLYADQGPRAVDTAIQATECAQQRLGDEHPATLNARDCLAVAYSMTGRTKEAVELGEQVLADCERILGVESIYTLAAIAHLASAYREAGRITDAIKLGERDVADSERILGPKDVHTLVGRANLASFYKAAGRGAEATKLGVGEQHAVFERILGPEHPHTLWARHILALSHLEVGRRDEAVDLDRQVVADCERILGSEHPETLRARDRLAVTYRKAERSDEAIKLGRQVVADYEGILGPEHPETLRARDRLAATYQAAGRTKDAIKLGEQVLADRERILGSQHHDTGCARADLAAWSAPATRSP
jgi:hypothetical protein